jgi:hypothetical protein
MTEKEFFNKVKGRKIYFTGWTTAGQPTKDTYFIPEEYFEGGWMVGSLQTALRLFRAQRCVIGKGFDFDKGNCWKVFEETAPVPKQCTCGAKHTCTPNSHLYYCELNTK